MENIFGKASSSNNWVNNNYTSNYAIGEITCKAGEIPYYYANYPTALEMSSRMYENNAKVNNYVKSGLTTGTMWDVIMRFISKKEDYSDLDYPTWGNYSDTTLTNCKGRYISVSANGTSAIQYDANHEHHHGMMTAGATEDNKKNNIYDLASNLDEFTQEYMLRNTSLITCVIRGGSCINSYKELKNMVTFRQGVGGIGFDLSVSYLSFRPILYIK